METFLKEWWGAITFVLGVAAWLGRGEMQTRQNSQAVRDVDAKYDSRFKELESEIKQAEERRSQQRLEDRENYHREFDTVHKGLDAIGADVKELLLRLPRESK